MSKNDSEQVAWASAHVREELPDLDEAHPHAGLVQNRGIRELVNYLSAVYDGDITETDIYRDIVRNEATDSLTDAVSQGNVSQMQYAIGMVSNEKNARNADTQAWMRNALLDEAYVGMVVGGMGSGKTAFALDRADDWHHATRGRVVTNVASACDPATVPEDVTGYTEPDHPNDVPEYAGSYSDVEDAFKNARTHILAIIDETDQRLTGKGSDQQAGEKIAKMLKLVRKGKAPAGTYRAILLVGQTIKGATKELRRLVTSNGHLWRKTSKYRVEVYDDVTSGELSNKKAVRTISGLKDARWNYDTGEESSFVMDVDADDADGGLTEKQRDLRVAVRAVALKGLSARDAASLVDFEKTWVNDRVSEWEDGEHVDVVGVRPSDIE